MYYNNQNLQKSVLAFLYLSLLLAEASEFLELKADHSHEEKNHPKDEFHQQHHLPETSGLELNISVPHKVHNQKRTIDGV